MLYVNDIILFSNRGFNNLLAEDLNDIPELIDEVSSQYLPSKGLRHVPRTAKILYNPLAYLLDEHEKCQLIERESIGLYNVSDICTLEPYYDFEEEIELFGVELANPMKAPYSLIGVITGWLAIREKLHNICLSLNSGACGIVSAMDLCKIDISSGDIKNGIVVGAHFMGEMYEKYNFKSTMKTEFSYALLLSNVPTEKCRIEILECDIRQYSEEYLEQVLCNKEGVLFIESDCCIDFVISNKTTYRIPFLSPQTSFFPIFLQNISKYEEMLSNENYYFIIEKKSIVGYIKFKQYNS